MCGFKWSRWLNVVSRVVRRARQSFRLGREDEAEDPTLPVQYCPLFTSPQSYYPSDFEQATSRGSMKNKAVRYMSVLDLDADMKPWQASHDNDLTVLGPFPHLAFIVVPLYSAHIILNYQVTTLDCIFVLCRLTGSARGKTTHPRPRASASSRRCTSSSDHAKHLGT